MKILKPDIVRVYDSRDQKIYLSHPFFRIFSQLIIKTKAQRRQKAAEVAEVIFLPEGLRRGPFSLQAGAWARHLAFLNQTFPAISVSLFSTKAPDRREYKAQCAYVHYVRRFFYLSTKTITYYILNSIFKL